MNDVCESFHEVSVHVPFDRSTRNHQSVQINCTRVAAAAHESQISIKSQKSKRFSPSCLQNVRAYNMLATVAILPTTGELGKMTWAMLAAFWTTGRAFLTAGMTFLVNQLLEWASAEKERGAFIVEFKFCCDLGCMGERSI